MYIYSSCLNDHGYVPLVVHTSRSFSHSWLIIKTRLKRRVSLVEQELLIFPEHLSSSPVFSGVRVTRSLVLCVWFVDHCLSFGTFSFDHCVVCSSSIYGFWLLLSYLQTLHWYSCILTTRYRLQSFNILVYLINPMGIVCKEVIRKVWRYQKGNQKP